jgi:histidinol-phosphate aminotransferase
MALPRPAACVPESGGGGIPAPARPVALRLDGNQGRAPGAGFWVQVGTDPELLRAYPSGQQLEQELARWHDCHPDQVVLTAGADEALDRICRAVLEPGRECVLPVPTFEMLERYARLSGASIRPVPWCEGGYPRAAVLAELSPRTGLCAIVSPNNPTGLCATGADVDALAIAAPDALVLVDAAYAEYAAEDLTAAGLRHRNVVVTRTFSKAWGLAGLRIGYAIADPEVARWLRALGSPFTCGTFARHAAVVRLSTGADEMRAAVAAVAHERQSLGELLLELGAAPLPSQANFVFVRVPDPDWLRGALSSLGIAVRVFRYGGAAPDGVRITLPGEAKSFARLGAALRTVLRPQALVLDLDGVLADVDGRRPLADPAVLAALARRLPLAVVTGCPGRLCDSILQRYGFAPFVRATVCAEDGPGKPDPAPVRLALRQLGTAHAWLCGDNPSDMQAACAAGVLPFAIAPQGIAAADRAADLQAAGAVRLVPDLAALAELLPPPIA